MRVPSADPIVTSLQTLVVAASSAYILLYAALVCLRISYPFELEWLEGAMVDHVRVVLEGQPLYARPSLAFTPLTYTPGYVYVAAGLSQVIGLGFVPLRLISVAASVVLLALIVKFVTHETGNWRAGVMAAGLFAALFGWTGGWLDLARNDSLFLALAMASVFVARRYPTPLGAAVAALLISLSFLTKQTGLIIAVPLALWCAVGGWRRGFAFAGVLVPLVAGTTWLFDRHFEGWYVFYIYDVPRQHPVSLQSIVGFWRYDLFNPLPIALGGALSYLAWRLTRRAEEIHRGLLPARGSRFRGRRVDFASALAEFRQRRAARAPGGGGDFLDRRARSHIAPGGPAAAGPHARPPRAAICGLPSSAGSAGICPGQAGAHERRRRRRRAVGRDPSRDARRRVRAVSRVPAVAGG